MRSNILFNNQSMAGNLTSVAFKFTNLERLSIHSVISGAPDGNLKIQFSNDAVDYDADVVNWIDYADSSAPILGVTQVMHNLRDISFRWVRLVYSRTSGTGFISSTFQTVKRF